MRFTARTETVKTVFGRTSHRAAACQRHLDIANIHRRNPVGERQVGGGAIPAPAAAIRQGGAVRDGVDHHDGVAAEGPGRRIGPTLRAAAADRCILARIVEPDAVDDEPD